MMPSPERSPFSPDRQHQQQQQQPSGPLRRLLPASGGGGAAPANDGNTFREKSTSTSASASTSHPLQAASGSSSVSGTLSPVVPPRRKRAQATTAACGACRKRKSKCDGERPVCSICRDRNTACEFDTNAAETHTQALKRKYNELQSQKSAFEQVYEVLQTRSEKEAVEVFRRIRRGTDAGSILRHVNYGDVLVQLALVPEARYRYEFPYLPDMPPFLRQLDNPYLDSEVYEYTLRGLRESSQQPGQQQPQQRLLTDSQTDSVSVYGAGQRDPYLKPYLSATVVHPWLDSVQPSKWTAVSDDDCLMRKLLHDYFLFEYDWFTFFHKDYFLEDMATENHRYCSPLLVNALLCIGCFCHRGLQGRAEFWNPRSLGYQFLAEAKRLFEIEVEVERPIKNPGDPDWERAAREWEQNRLLTIQAALLLTLIHNLNGSDKIGWRRYTLKAIEMANEIQLLGPPLDKHAPEVQCARTYTAWGLFCWQSLGSYHYLKPPPITKPPEAPLPDPSEQPQWYGELWVKYPLSQSRLPTYHGFLFKAIADFWTIVNEFAALAFSHDRSPVALPVNRILGFYNRLRAWQHNLPEPLTPKKIVLPHQLKLHMHYNHMLIDLVTPVLDYPGTVGPELSQTPRDIYIEAVTHFETIVRLYYLRHGFEATDSFLLHFLGFLNHITMNAIETSAGSSFLEARRSTMLLLTKGIHDQSRVHFVARAILRLQVSRMQPQDVDLLKQVVEIEEDQVIYGPLEQAVHSDWPEYDFGLEAKAERLRQGKTLTSSLASLSLESNASPASSRSPA